MREPTVWIDDLRFGEGPRYRGGKLYLSDQHDRVVIEVVGPGRRQTVVRVEHGPSGLGWLPDGTMLVVSMHDRKLLALSGGVTRVHADLSAIATGHCNDMVVDGKGRAYVGNFGFDMDAGAEFAHAKLALVEPDGRARVVAEDLMFPNGMVISPDGKTLILAETYGARLTAFDIGPDGGLSNRRLWAQLATPPDGICLDAEGCVWIANPIGEGGFHRVAEGGEVKATIGTGDMKGIACMLGGPDRRTLYLVEAATFDPTQTKTGNARLRVTEVDVPGAGLP